VRREPSNVPRYRLNSPTPNLCARRYAFRHLRRLTPRGGEPLAEQAEELKARMKAHTRPA
jgi:hypothetical protein